MTDYPLRVKIVASLAIVLAYVVGLPLFGLMYLAGYWADIAGPGTPQMQVSGLTICG